MDLSKLDKKSTETMMKLKQHLYDENMTAAELFKY